MIERVSRNSRPSSRTAARGRPSTMAKTTRVRPKKQNSRQPRNTEAAPYRPAVKAARTTPSSL